MRSIFLWRMTIAVIITILLASLLMTGGYMILIRNTYADIVLQELEQQAQNMCGLYIEYMNGALSYSTFSRLLEQFLGKGQATVCIIADNDGSYVYKSESLSGYSKEALLVFDNMLKSAIEGHSFFDSSFDVEQKISVLNVGIPIIDDNGKMYGGIILLRSFDELSANIGKLNNLLFMVVIMVLPIMVMLLLGTIKRLADPLRKIGEVAIKMRGGDFTVRADESEPGEVGLLARALNDICSDLSNTINELRSEKSQLKQILASFSEGVVALDSVGYLTHYNSAVMQMFGAVHVEGRSDLIQDEGIWRAFDEVYTTGEPRSMRYPLPGDIMLWVTISPVVTEDGNRSGVVGLFKDMTQVEKLERMRTEYVANVSHELRTPLTSIRGLLEPLADGMVASEGDKQRYYKIMLREVIRLSHLITDMMQLSRLQSGTEYTQFIETDVGALLRDVIQNYSKDASEKGVRLILNCTDMPLVYTDSDRVEQLLIILIDNAMRHTAAGGNIILKAQNAESVVIVSVVDTGEGIPKEDLPHIFERFYTVDKSRNQGGTGLGLSIAKHIISRLDERITVESELGKGTQFSFTLKKYVRNAIALGPAIENGNIDEDTELPPILLPQQNGVTTLDAPYEVLPVQSKEKRMFERKKK